MLLCIPNVLNPQQVAHCLDRMAEADWVNGRATAGQQSAVVKQNSQITEGSPVAVELGNIVLDALGACPQFVSAALPQRTFPPLFNRYQDGQYFGTHTDNAIRIVKGTSIRIRTDLSATLFLSAPETYDGGELVIEDNFGVQEVKLAAGDMVLYPSSSLHHVNPVTRGARISSFFWVQSMVRDDTDRALLYDLDQSVQEMTREQGIDHPVVVKISGIYHNLIRRWADT